MNHYAYVMMMLDIARRQSEAADRRFREARLAADMTAEAPGLRRVAARLVASVSRGSARIVRRLDDCVADELGRSLTPAE
ncbi:MAG: hypothetical protein WEE50_03835 [Chloroflexota bacterium]